MRFAFKTAPQNTTWAQMLPVWREADSGGAPADFAHKRDVLFAHCQAVGRDPAEITLSLVLKLYTRNVHSQHLGGFG